MSTFTVEVNENKLFLPTDAIEKLGWPESTKILFEKDNGRVVIRPLELTAKEIARLAGIYLAKYVGDATDVKRRFTLPVNGAWKLSCLIDHKPSAI